MCPTYLCDPQDQLRENVAVVSRRSSARRRSIFVITSSEVAVARHVHGDCCKRCQQLLLSTHLCTAQPGTRRSKTSAVPVPAHQSHFEIDSCVPYRASFALVRGIWFSKHHTKNHTLGTHQRWQSMR